MPKNSSKRKRGPWNPARNIMPDKVAKDLGLGVERLQHSKAGFEPEPTGIGHFRLKEKAMLTHPALLAERTNIALRAYADQGKTPDNDVQINQTPSDRATAMWRKLLWDWLVTHYEVEQGKAGRTNFEKSSHSSDLNRVPLTDDQFSRRGFYSWLRTQPMGKDLSDFLTDIAAQCNPQACGAGQRVMSKSEIGAWLLDADNPRDTKNACDGALALACRLLAGAQAHYVAMKRYERHIVKK